MMEIYSEGFWITIAGLVIGFLGLTTRMCLRSKCDNVECCWCLKIHRDVEVEERIEDKQMEHGIFDKENDNKI